MGRQTGVIIASFVASHVALLVCIIALSTPHWLLGSTTIYVTNSTNGTNLAAESRSTGITSVLFLTSSGEIHNTSQRNITVERNCHKGFWTICCENEHNHLHNESDIKLGIIHQNEDFQSHLNNDNETKNSSYKPATWTGCQSTNPVTHSNQTAMFRVALFCFTFGVANFGIGTFFLYVFMMVKRVQRSILFVGITMLFFIVASIEFLVALLVLKHDYKHGKDGDFSTHFETQLGWSFIVGCIGTGFSVASAMCSIYFFAVVKSAGSTPYENLQVNT